MRIVSSILIGLCMTTVGLAHATQTEEQILAHKTVASKYYVDDRVASKQPILNPNSANWQNQVVMYTNEAGHVNTAIQNGLNNHVTCMESNKDPVTNNCWLYTINDQAAGTIYTQYTSGN